MISNSVTDLACLHDALSCASMAADQAWRGDEDSVSLSLYEAHAAAEEAFGAGSPGADALNVVFAAIAQAAHSKTNRPAAVFAAPRPASDLSRLGQERTMTNSTTAARASAIRSLADICRAARQANCGVCWQRPGKPCTRNPEGDHVARFGRAMRRGLLTGPELIAVLGALDAFTNATVVETPVEVTQ
jgi:hypothetical protein